MEFNKSNRFNNDNENKNQNLPYYVAKCDNKINSICKFSEDEFKDWNGKCAYGKDGGVYCTAKFKLVDENK